MKRTLMTCALWLCMTSVAVWAQPGKGGKTSDDDIRKLIVQASIAAYPGACPCPESRKENGDRCGKSSAYSKAGGNKPLCYPRDVSDAAVARFRKSASGD